MVCRQDAAAVGRRDRPADRPGDEARRSRYGATFDKEERRILSWSDDKTLRLWDVSWRGKNLFEIACNHAPQNHDLARLSVRYGCQDPPIQFAKALKIFPSRIGQRSSQRLGSSKGRTLMFTEVGRA